MLLEDLINTRQKERKVETIPVDVAFNKRSKLNNKGVFGGVKDIADPHLIQKANFRVTQEAEDGYYLYIKYVVDNDLADSNPYFPRVYSIKALKDSTDNIKYKIDLERLVATTTLDKDEIIYVFKKIFVDRLRYGMLEDAEITQSSLESWIAASVRSPDKFEFADDLYRQAIEIIFDQGEAHGKSMDIHYGNFMFRRLSSGLQLVFTDPWY